MNTILTLKDLVRVANGLLESQPELADLPIFTTDTFNDPIAQRGPFSIEHTSVHGDSDNIDECVNFTVDCSEDRGTTNPITCILFGQIP